MGLNLNHMSASAGFKRGSGAAGQAHAIAVSGAAYFQPDGKSAGDAAKAKVGFPGHTDAAYIFSGSASTDGSGTDKTVFLGDIVISGTLNGGKPLNAQSGADNRVAVFKDADTVEGDANFQYDGLDMTLGTSVGLIFGSGSGEKIEGDGSKLTIAAANLDLTMEAGGDVALPNNVGLIFGDSAEKIEGDGTDLTVAGNNIKLTAAADVVLPSGVGLVLDGSGDEKIESDGTDISIAVGSGGDVNLPSAVGLTFGDDGEKIEGDGTDLTIASSAKINLTATSDVILPDSVGMLFGDVSAGGEKIEGDGTDLTIASSNDLNLTATADINVPANVGLTFGDDAEKIEGDGTDLTVAGNNIKLTAVADVILPASVGLVLDGAGNEKIESDGTDISIAVGSGGDVNLPADIGLTFGDDGEKIEGDGSNLTITGGDIFLTAEADVKIPANVGLILDGTGDEKIESDGTDISIAVGSGGDVNLPANVGLTFGDDGEKIEGDGAELTVTGKNILLTAADDVILPSGVGLVLDGSGAEKIESDGTDISIAVGSGGDVNLPSAVGLVFGDDGEKIEGDGTDLAIASSNDLNMTVANSLVIDAQGTDNGDGVKVLLGTDTAFAKLKVHNNSDAEKFSVDALGDVSVGRDLAVTRNVTITGNLDVNGSTTTIDTKNMTVEDSIIGLGVSGSDGSFSNVGERAIIFARAASAADALPAINYNGSKFEVAKYLASPTSQSMGSASSYVTFKAGSIESSALTNDRVIFAGSSGNLEDSASLTFDGSDLQLADNVGLVLSSDDSEKIESDGTDINIAVGSGGDVNLPSAVGLTFGDDGEKIEGDGTDLTIASSADLNLTATADINVPANVGLTFGDDAEKIEGDGTDLTVAGNNIKLTAAADVVLPASVGLVLDGSGDEKIESDGTDISIAVGSGGDVNLPANIGLTFGDDGEKIEGDGTDLTVAGNNIKLTAVADVILPSGVGLVLDGSGNEKIESDGTDISFAVGSGGDINIPSSIGLTFGDDGEKIEGDGTDLTVAGNNVKLTAVADVVLPADVGLVLDGSGDDKIESDGTDVTFAVGGGDLAVALNGSSEGALYPVNDNQDTLGLPADSTTIASSFQSSLQTSPAQTLDDTLAVPFVRFSVGSLPSGVSSIQSGDTITIIDGNSTFTATASGAGATDATFISSLGSSLKSMTYAAAQSSFIKAIRLSSSISGGSQIAAIQQNDEVIMADGSGRFTATVSGTPSNTAALTGTFLTFSSGQTINSSTTSISVSSIPGEVTANVKSGDKLVLVQGSVTAEGTLSADPSGTSYLFSGGFTLTGGSSVSTDSSFSSAGFQGVGIPISSVTFDDTNDVTFDGDPSGKTSTITARGIPLTGGTLSGSAASGDTFASATATRSIDAKRWKSILVTKVELDSDEDTSIRASADDVITFEAGGTDRFKMTTSAFEPLADNSYDLGSASLRFRNIFTGDLSLRNERGDWTLIEENDFISFRNNKTGRRFRMIMEDITGMGNYGPGNDGEM